VPEGRKLETTAEQQKYYDQVSQSVYQRNKKNGTDRFLTNLREKTFRRTLNCLFYRLLRALIGGQAYERAPSGNVIQCPPDEGREDSLSSGFVCSVAVLLPLVITNMYMRVESGTPQVRGR
jgi:hypothetical protein